MSGSSRGQGRRREPVSRTTQISKKLSWLLRHGAEKENLSLGPGGYANVADVLANRNLRSLNVAFAELQTIVADNDKQRYQLIRASDLSKDASGSPTDGSSKSGKSPVKPPSAFSDPTLWLIRATQGHSLKIQDEDPSHSLLTPLSSSSPDLPRAAVHGTTRAAWPLILASGGLKTMGRNHVHFATGVPEGFTSLASANATRLDSQQPGTKDGPSEVALPVISGMRKSSTVLIFLDLRKALDAGIKFGMSANGVILSEGNADGLVSTEFFERVEDWRLGKVLFENGATMNEDQVR